MDDVGDIAARYPWPATRPWVRAVMVMGLDGAIVGPDGKSGSLSGPADRRVLVANRRLADAIVVGAQTMRVEPYGPMIARPEWEQARRDAGLAIAPRLVFVSRSLDLPWDAPAFRDSALPPIVVTNGGHDDAAIAQAAEVAQVIQSPSSDVDPNWLVATLAELGLSRIVCEGGRNLLDAFVRAGRIDEWALTIAGKAGPREYRLAATTDEDGFLFTRYVGETIA